MNEQDELEFYKNIFNQLPKATLLIDIDDGRIIDANNEATLLFNIPQEQILKLKQDDLYPPYYSKNEEKHEFHNCIKDIIHAIDQESFEHFVIDSKEDLIPVEITPRLVQIKQKTYALIALKDMRSTKFHENILYYYDKALNKSSSLLSFVDKDYTYRFANSAYFKVFNKKSEDIIGKTVPEVVGNEHFNKNIKEKIDLALAGEAVEFDTNLQKDGKTFYLQAHYEPYYSIDNQIIGIVASVYDLTKFKEYEKESLVKEKLMINQSKMAAMGEMLENIAHQWRQPLSVISTCTSGILLQREFNTLEESFLDESLNTIMDTTAYLSNTIDDFKNFFERDKEKTRFSLQEITNKALDMLIVSLKEHEIKLVKEFCEDIYLESYKSEFMQVLLNIINNAKDAHKTNLYDDNKQKTIKVKIYKENNLNVIEIQDNAGGIKQEILEKIFEPYFTTKHKSQGTGIGLFMTRQIITNHMNGNINVSNINMKVDDVIYNGASFKIFL